MGKGVLIVSRDPEFRCAVDVSITQMKYETVLASSVTEALELAASSRPGVLVTDLSIQRQRDGMDLAGELRQRLPNLRCVITGDCDSNGHLGSAGKHPWIRTFMRPFSMIQFVGAVEEAVRHTSRQHRE